MSRTIRTLTALATVTATLGVLVGAASSAAAADRQATDDDLATKFQTMTLPGKLALDPLTGKASIVGLKELTQLLDAAGKALSPVTVRSVKTEGGSAIGNYACLKTGKAKNGFVEFNRTDVFARGKEGVLQYQFFPYMQADARRFANSPTTQYEVCGTGGADLQEGYRIHQTGMGIAFPDTNRTFKIGQNWQSGKTPSDTTVSLGFELGGKTSPVSVNGSISQNPSDKLKGSIVGPYATDLDAFARNGVNAWWEDSCVQGWSHCKFRADGSPNFQGTVVHGLWEFMPADALQVRYFAIQPYIKLACHGFRCG